ncbi:MAG TPA: hypothetical protein VGP99_00710 [Tepidisphaeraceae bacterium]|nr:hypothetical protein [Tepidisphaeraceae bacterium]
MPAPVYPTILTKADWDKNKGTIGKAPNELGIGPAVSAAWNAWTKVDWSVLNECSIKNLAELAHPLAIHLVMRIQQAIPRIPPVCEALQNLANIIRDVLARYGRAATFPKPTLEHIAKMQQAAIEFRATLLENNLQRELVLARKARGYALIRPMTFDQLLANTQVAALFHPVTQRGFCDVPFEFLLDTMCTLKGQLPPADKADQMYVKYIKDNDANVAAPIQAKLKGYYDKKQLANPPAELRAEVCAAWESAHKESKKMFPQRYGNWKSDLQQFKPNDNTLLAPFLQI